MKFQTHSESRIECVGWAFPSGEFTLDDLIKEMEILGNQVLEIDRPRNRLRVLHVQQEGLLG